MKPAMTRPLLKQQRGMMMLESLVAILIFSLGVLALLALQGNAIRRVGDNKYRADAVYLANDLIGTIWARAAANSDAVKDFNCSNCKTSTNAVLQSWLDRVKTGLPGVGDDIPPDIVVTQDAKLGNQVTITVRWKVADNSGGNLVTSQYQAIAYINPNPTK